jgi:hypothetical protein
LKRDVLEFVPGQKVRYVTDVSGDERNREKITTFVRDADLLFIEAVLFFIPLLPPRRRPPSGVSARLESAPSARILLHVIRKDSYVEVDGGAHEPLRGCCT